MVDMQPLYHTHSYFYLKLHGSQCLLSQLCQASPEPPAAAHLGRLGRLSLVPSPVASFGVSVNGGTPKKNQTYSRSIRTDDQI